MGQYRIDLEDAYLQSEAQIKSLGSETSICFLDLVSFGKELRDASINPAGWVKLLGADNFRVRQNATRQLENMGEEKLPALLAEINSKDPERQDRVLKILEKSYNFLNLKDSALLSSPGKTFSEICNIDAAHFNNHGINKALKSFDPNLVDKEERSAIDGFFAGLIESVPASSHAGKIYALQKVFENPKRQLLRFAFRDDPSLELANDELHKLQTMAKKFPSICENPAFLLKLQSSLPKVEPGKQSEDEREFVKNLPLPYCPTPDGRPGAVSWMLSLMRQFERSEAYEKARGNVSESRQTGNSDKLLLQVRADPRIVEEPKFLAALLDCDVATINRIARGALSGDARRRFEEGLFDVIAMYPLRR